VSVLLLQEARNAENDKIIVCHVTGHFRHVCNEIVEIECIDPVYASKLDAAYIKTVNDPLEVNSEKNSFACPPYEQNVESWIEQAKSLEPI
jgi:predicted RNA-binding protein